MSQRRVGLENVVDLDRLRVGVHLEGLPRRHEDEDEGDDAADEDEAGEDVAQLLQQCPAPPPWGQPRRHTLGTRRPATHNVIHRVDTT